jgi:hypothetical protein
VIVLSVLLLSLVNLDESVYDLIPLVASKNRFLNDPGADRGEYVLELLQVGNELRTRFVHVGIFERHWKK